MFLIIYATVATCWLRMGIEPAYNRAKADYDATGSLPTDFYDLPPLAQNKVMSDWEKEHNASAVRLANTTSPENFRVFATFLFGILSFPYVFRRGGQSTGKPKEPK